MLNVCNLGISLRPIALSLNKSKKPLNTCFRLFGTQFVAPQNHKEAIDLGFGPRTGTSEIKPNDQIHIAMSGGVDSSVVAALMASRFGPERVHGIFMNNWSLQSKCQEESWRGVRQVCEKLGISSTRIDLERDYWTDVFEPMIESYRLGFTPNPDIFCNSAIKFGKLITFLRSKYPDFRWIATGHYCGKRRFGLNEGAPTQQPFYVTRGADPNKDQSYYLSNIDNSALDYSLFPLAHLRKPIVREMATYFGLDEVASKPDSQGLCFVEQQDQYGQRGFRKFLAEYLEDTPGPIRMASKPDTVVGEHKGLWTHTIGQRINLAMPQHTEEMRGKWYVVRKSIEENALFIDRRDSKILNVDRVAVKFKWLRTPSENTELYAQFRSLQKPWRVSGFKNYDTHTEFAFDETREAVAPGQWLVIYENGDTIIGSGIIETSSNSQSSKLQSSQLTMHV